MAAVMILLGKSDLDWAGIKREMTDPKFADKLVCLDKDNMSEETMKKLEAITKQDNFLPQILMKKSLVAAALCSWVRAVEEYHKGLVIIRPKIEKMEDATRIV